MAQFYNSGGLSRKVLRFWGLFSKKSGQAAPPFWGLFSKKSINKFQLGGGEGDRLSPFSSSHPEYRHGSAVLRAPIQAQHPP